MQHFNDIHFEGFRRLSNFRLELRPLCVLIGAERERENVGLGCILPLGPFHQGTAEEDAQRHGRHRREPDRRGCPLDGVEGVD